VWTSTEEQPSTDSKKATQHNGQPQPPAAVVGAPPWVTVRAPEADRRIRGAHLETGQMTGTHIVSHVRVRWSGQEGAWEVRHNSCMCAHVKQSERGGQGRKYMGSTQWGAKTGGVSLLSHAARSPTY
jgi:hypothetical protein